jgi:hypothetical protein
MNALPIPSALAPDPTGLNLEGTLISLNLSIPDDWAQAESKKNNDKYSIPTPADIKVQRNR